MISYLLLYLNYNKIELARQFFVVFIGYVLYLFSLANPTISRKH